MDEQFTFEEANLMCIFDMANRAAHIAELTAAMQEFDEPELIEIAESALAKLATISDADFAALGLYPEYGVNDEEQEV